MISTVGAIILAVLAAAGAAAVTSCIYERKLYENELKKTEDLSYQVEDYRGQVETLETQLARLNGISEGRECDAMQRRFLESLHDNGQSTVMMGRRTDA